MDNAKVQESWNMATETLKRLSRCLDMCSFSSQIGDLQNWLNASFDLRKNLIPFLEKNEIEILEDKLHEMPRLWKTREGRVIPKYYSKVYGVLDSFYVLCVCYMKDKGLLMPKTTDPRAAVLNN